VQGIYSVYSNIEDLTSFSRWTMLHWVT